MSPTLLEGATAILLLWIAWKIGSLLAPRIIRKLRQRYPSDRKNKRPYIIDIEK